MNKILIVRHDKIGDFVLTWPAFYMIKKVYPQAKITVLVAPEVKSFAQACPYIDEAIVDTSDDELTNLISESHYDAALVLHSQWRICKMVRQAKIPYTLGPKLNWYQYFYKQRTSIQYKKGEPCWRGNCMLIEHFLAQQGIEIPTIPSQLWDVSLEKETWKAYYKQEDDEKLIFVHAGSGGSSASLSVANFSKLLTQVHALSDVNIKVILTFSGNEETLAIELKNLLQAKKIKAELALPLKSLADFAKSLVAADMFIAGSTGPLHLAGLHNVPTVGFYAGRKSEPKVRWQTLTQASKRLAFTPPIGRKTGRDMSLVDIDKAASDIAQFMNKNF